MPKNLTSKNISVTVVKEENSINWELVLNKLKTGLGSDIYESWLKGIILKKEFNHYVILSAPTRFVRDWIVSRYVDKILDIIKTFKPSIQRIEFLIEETKTTSIRTDINKNNKVSVLEDSLLNYNRFNLNNSFDNFISI